MNNQRIRPGRTKVEIDGKVLIKSHRYQDIPYVSGYVNGTRGSQIIEGFEKQVAHIILVRTGEENLKYLLFQNFRIRPDLEGTVLHVPDPLQLMDPKITYIKALEYHGPYRNFGMEWEIMRGVYFYYLPNQLSR